MLYKIKNDFIELYVDNHGAEIKSLKFLNQERMHNSNPEYWNRSAPLLFPCIGTITNKSTIINNQSYPLPKHGFIRDVDFTLTEQTSDHLTFYFTANEETKKMYPFTFTIEVSYYLINQKMQSKIIIKNLDSSPMPFNFGLHPAFKTPITEDEKWEDYEISTQSTTNHPIYKVELSNGTINFDEIVREISFQKPLSLKHEDYQNDALVFDHLDFDKLTLSNKAKNHGVTFKFNGFPMLGIWTPYPKKAPFICLEPWIGCADPTTFDGEFIHKKYLQILNPQESQEITYEWLFF